MNIVLQIKTDGEWKTLEEIPDALAEKMVSAVINRGMDIIGFTPDSPGKKSAVKASPAAR